ncbi:hypothetical protein [Saccharibacillus qingshengii]|uniref:hypothetical protein n=1 Tax=Saccharibacillus qingshengii TaxID=1763540 RepID=UPI001552752C|nr:hypothetical protein [Saccharibacillus qingshengii]
MAKVIKFNLIVDGKSIRTLTDLCDNFNVDDVYDLYKSGVLKKWLDVRGYTQEAQAIEALNERKEESLFDIIPKLIKIFIEVNDSNLNRHAQESYATVLKLFNDNKLKEAQENGFQSDLIIRKYHSAYENIKEGIEANPQNFNYIKSYLQEIENRYIELFKLDYQNFYDRYKKDEPLVILLALANSSLRTVLWECKEIKEDIQGLYQDVHDVTEVSQKAGPHIKTFVGSTNGLWKYLGDKGKKYMVIHLEGGACRVGEERTKNVDYSWGDINGNYLILEELLFKSDSSYLSVTYMEV